MTKKLLKITLFLIIVQFFSVRANAQFGIPDTDELKAQARAKKLEKSPAREEIMKIEEGIAELDRELRQGSLTMASPDSTTYADLDKEIAELEALVPVIAEKDPKWAAKNDYATPIAEHRAYWKKRSDDYWLNVASSKRYNWLFQKSEYIRWKLFNTGDVNYLGNNYRSIVYILIYSYFMERMGAFDYKGTKGRMVSIIKEDPALESYEHYLKIKTFYDQTFPEFINGPALEFLDEIKKECTGAFETNPSDCYEWLGDGINYCNEILSLIPENTAYKSKKSELENKKLEFDKYLEENVYTSAFHKAHVGQTLFSNKPIVIGQEKEEDFKTTFLAGESIYAVTYWMAEKVVKFDYNFWINEEYQYSGQFYASKDGESTVWGTYYTFAIIPDPEIQLRSQGPAELETMNLVGAIVSSIKANSVGEKKIKIGLARNESTFEIDYSNGYSELEAKHEKLLQQRRDALRLPKAKSTNAEIAAQWSKAVLEPGETMVAVRVLSSSWEFEKNSYGIIESRYAYVSCVVKNKAGVCTMLNGVVTQDKGDGGYTAPWVQYDKYFENIDGNDYENGWDGTERAEGEEGFRCNCSTVLK